MQLADILILFICLLLLRMIPREKLQKRILIFISVLFLFRLQPVVPIRNFDFWFPILTIGITLFCWVICCSEKEEPGWIDLVAILAAVLLAEMTRFLDLKGFLTRTRPPQLWVAAVVLAGWSLILLLIKYLGKKHQKTLISAGIIFLILILTLLKTPILALKSSMFLRTLNGQSAENALSADLRWIGFSYLAFRLLSVLIDTRNGRQLAAGPGEFFLYVCFPPTLSAGPIDRFDHFHKELNSNTKDIQTDLLCAADRIGTGLFKKFIIADSLSYVALSSENVNQFTGAGWAWAALIFYGLQLYFDFSGYSDIAIGLGKILGITLPENFQHPYLKPDIAKFWNSWHITLTQWIRIYVFNPLTRRLRMLKKHPLPQWLIILISQFVTMLLIGIWHGVTLNFVLWGLWHGAGLFFHQQYEQRTKARLYTLRTEKQQIFRAYTFFSTVLTVLFVMLGWVWFALPDFGSAIQFYNRLF